MAGARFLLGPAITCAGHDRLLGPGCIGSSITYGQDAIPLGEAKLDPHAIHTRARARIRAGDAARRWHDTLLTFNGASPKGQD